MALTKISTGGVKDDAASQAKIADEAIDEARLQISNTGTNGQFLSKQTGNTGGLTWATVTVPDADKVIEGNTSIETVDTGSDGHVKITTEGTEKVRVIADGKVGIGTNSPTSLFHVAGAGAPQIKVQDTDTAGGYAHFKVNNDALYIESFDEDGTAGEILFENGTTEAMRIGYGGKVGIGCTNPQDYLDLGNATAGKGIAWGGTAGTSHYSTIWNEYSSGSLVLASGLKGSTTNQDFIVPWTGTMGYAAIELDSFNDDGIKFYTAPDTAKTKGDAVTKNERFRIGTSGQLGIGGATYGSDGQVLTSKGGSAAPEWAAVDTGGEVVRQAQYTSSTSYTVPSGITTIRAYAVGAGGNGGICGDGEYGQTSGAGGGMAYGDFTVSPGQTVTISISNRVATVSYGGTTLLTGNPGSHAADNPSSLTYATAGTATKHSSVTNGGAYSGGAGGYIATGGSGPGGASAGSPLGAGGRANKGGGCGIGGGVYNAYPGGGAGSSSGIDYVGGGSGPNQNGRDGARYAFYTDPLIQGCVMPGLRNNYSTSLPASYYYHGEAPTGVGGQFRRNNSMGNGGSFAGGAGGSMNISGALDNNGGDGGVLAGGGAAGGSSGTFRPGDGGYGGGGGAANHHEGSVVRAQGGGAVVWIFHT